MTKEEMIRLVRENDKAEYVRLGFIYAHKLYSIDLDFIPDEFIRLSTASRGQGAQLRIYVPAATRAMMVVCGATCEGPESLVHEQGLNRGHAYEKYITETYEHKVWKKDSIPFYVQGDCVLDGKQVQVKLDNGTITNEKILRDMLKKMGKVA